MKSGQFIKKYSQQQKTVLLLVIGFLSVVFMKAQVVQWGFSARKITDRTYELYIKATIDEGWHIYSQTTPRGGPLPTTIRFLKNPLLNLQDGIREEGNMVIYHDKGFDVDVYAFSEEVNFIQVVKLKGNLSGSLKTRINGTIEFMACTNERCLAPEKKPFSIEIK
jgi:hypothetical protein